MKLFLNCVCLSLFVLTAFAHGADPIDVSLVQLIAAPEKWNGKLVRVIGFCHLEFEGNGLYLHRDDYTASISKNAVWLSEGPVEMRRNPKKFSNKYVLIEGTFDAGNQGHMGMWSGAIDGIRRIEPWKRVPR